MAILTHHSSRTSSPPFRPCTLATLSSCEFHRPWPTLKLTSLSGTSLLAYSPHKIVRLLAPLYPTLILLVIMVS